MLITSTLSQGGLYICTAGLSNPFLAAVYSLITYYEKFKEGFSYIHALAFFSFFTRVAKNFYLYKLQLLSHTATFSTAF